MNAQQRIQRQLEEVLKMPGNERCADCRSAAPRWASVNLGIFLCVTCASIHRKMGTHRSRVKSVTLDEWTREQVMNMKDIGNTKSNAIYNPDPKRNAPPATVADERDSEIQKFIRRKYELGAFKANAARDLATASVNSRTQAMQARGALPVPSPESTSSTSLDMNRDLPALPASQRQRPARSITTGPTWASLGKSNTGSTTSSSSSNSLAPPVTPAALPPRSASHSSPNMALSLALKASPPKGDLLIDVDGSASSTRPLQLAGFATIPAAPAVNPLSSPVGNLPAPSPLALGQQAFFAQLSPQPQQTNQNPFGMQYGQSLQPMQQQSYMQNQMGSNQLGMSMNGGMSNGMMGQSMNSSMGMMGSQQGMMMMNHTGMGMGGHMNGGMGMAMGMGGGMGMGGVQMAQPVQYQQQQYAQAQWGYT